MAKIKKYQRRKKEIKKKLSQKATTKKVDVHQHTHFSIQFITDFSEINLSSDDAQDVHDVQDALRNP
ncbi:MAG: hypothetical protein IKK67_06740, partial [Bacteroidaceae bacterium]|nr:hypothetical protein [Bacteroidaceae bacterium]